MNYYNEIDPKAAAWLRELIARGLIAPGVVDERSIADVRPHELAGFTQHHFFAGIGGWPLALRIAGWPDHRPVWTGSCPCPPFSAAGKGQKCPECGSKSNICHPRKTGHFVCLDCGCDRYADDRHLWPEFARLIRQCDAPVTFGEQVASADGRLWLAAVRADLEGMGRALGGADLCAAGVGAPNIRQRLWFVTERAGSMGDAFLEGLEGHGRHGDDGHQPGWFGADAARHASAAGSVDGMEHPTRDGRVERWSEPGGRGAAGGCGAGGMADAGRTGDERLCGPGEAFGTAGAAEGEARQWQWSRDADRAGGSSGRMAFPDGRQRIRLADGEGRQRDGQAAGWIESDGEPQSGSAVGRPRSFDEFWRDADWLFCRDERWRPVESESFPLAHGVPARVVRLRGYGNAINPYAAAAFIRAYMESGAELDLAAGGVSGVKEAPRSTGLTLEDLL